MCVARFINLFTVIVAGEAVEGAAVDGWDAEQCQHLQWVSIQLSPGTALWVLKGTWASWTCCRRGNEALVAAL